MVEVKEIEDFVKENLDELNWLHTKDVRNIALEIAEKENADKEVVEIAALLHDIGKSDKNADILNHHKIGIGIAKKLLEEKGVNPELIEKVCHCIDTHMGPPNILRPQLEEAGKGEGYHPRPDTKEAKTLYDADMINLCGPFGVLKLVYIRTKKGMGFREAVDVVKNICFEAFNDLQTETGKEIGEKYWEISKEFFERVGV